MNKLVLLDSTEFYYSNAVYNSDNKTLEFKFAPEHKLEDVEAIFSESGALYDIENISKIQLVDDNEQVLGVWEGFNILNTISATTVNKYGQLGESIQQTSVTVILQKETVSDEFKRSTGITIEELKAQNALLLTQTEILSSANLELQSESASNMLAMAEMFETNISLQEQNSSAMIAITELFESNLEIVELNTKLQEENNVSLMAITELYESVSKLEQKVADLEAKNEEPTSK